MTTPPDTNPRSVTPGIETHPHPNVVAKKGIYGRPDWCRLVGPESQREWLYRVLCDVFGDQTIPSSGAKFFRAGLNWPQGVMLSDGHKSQIVMVDLQGACWSSTDTQDLMDLVERIMIRGFHCTRIDLAVDHMFMDLKLYEHALASCQAGELCKLRTYSPDPEHKSDGTPTRLLLKLGKRDSPVCVRIYDKGLEQGSGAPGFWERIEVEFKEDRANQICIELLQNRNEMPRLLQAFVIGSVDFRIHNGRSEIDRRPRVRWWESYFGGAHPRKPGPVPQESGLESWCDWFRHSVGPRLIQLATLMGTDPVDFVLSLLKGLEPAVSETRATIEARAGEQRN